VYVYGHTHRPAATEVDGRLVVNTGTWLKRLHRVDPLLGILPPVYYASYQPTTSVSQRRTMVASSSSTT